jgi:hypothetical protein
MGKSPQCSASVLDAGSAPAMERNDNTDWRVTDAGLEHAATGYLIEPAVLGARRGDGLWEWPLQLAEKAWCRPAPFAAAFRAALARFGIAGDAALDLSLATAFAAPMSAPPGGFRSLAEIVSTPATRASLRRPAARRRSAPVAARTAARTHRLAEAGA